MRTLKIGAFTLALLFGGLLAVPEAQTTIRRGFSQAFFGDGSAAAPSVSFASRTDTGFRYASTGLIVGVSQGTDRFQIGPQGAQVTSADFYGFSSGAITGSNDTIIGRPAAGALYLAGASGTNGIRFQFNGVPTIGTCGTSPSVTAGSLDTEGEVNVGTGGTATACGITFNGTWGSAPRCVAGVNTATPANARAIGVTTTTTTAIFTAATAYAASDKVWWICIGTK